MRSPVATRRSPFEGWYWRVVDPAGGRVVVALCGICRPRRGAPWAVVALAAHPGGVVRWGLVDGAAGDEDGFGAWACPLLRGTGERLRASVDDFSVDVALQRATTLDRPSLRLAHRLPGLAQYWHAHQIDAEVEGTAVVAGETWRLDGARAYTEKNWGPDFAADWWWGQAHLDERVAVSFAGGRVGPISPTGLVLRLGEGLHRLVAPFAAVRAEVAAGAWRVSARSSRLRLEVEGDGSGAPAHLLPVPDVDGRSCALRSRQHLAGRLRLTVREGRRLRFSGETSLAGLERGLPPTGPPA